MYLQLLGLQQGGLHGLSYRMHIWLNDLPKIMQGPMQIRQHHA